MKIKGGHMNIIKNKLLGLLLIFTPLLHSFEEKLVTTQLPYKNNEQFNDNQKVDSHKKLLSMVGLMGLITALTQNEITHIPMKRSFFCQTESLFATLTIAGVLALLWHHYFDHVHNEDETELPQPYDFCD